MGLIPNDTEISLARRDNLDPDKYFYSMGQGQEMVISNKKTIDVFLANYLKENQKKNQKKIYISERNNYTWDKIINSTFIYNHSISKNKFFSKLKEILNNIQIIKLNK